MKASMIQGMYADLNAFKLLGVYEGLHASGVYGG